MTFGCLARAGIAIVAAAQLACTTQLAGSPEEPATEPRPPRTVRIARPQPADAERWYASNLYVEKDVVVTPRTSGIIERVLVDRGDRVRTGQALAVLETDLVSREVEIAQQDLRLADAEFDRMRSLHRQSVVSEREFLRAEITRDQAASNLEYVRGRLERYTVRAPFDGVVLERWAVLGERVDVDAGPSLFRVAAQEPPRARVDVPEGRLAGLDVGSTASLRVPGRDDPVPAQVVFVSPAIDPASGTAPIIVEAASGQRGLRLGAAVRVGFEELESESLPLGIPRDALPRQSIRDGGRATVLVVAGGLVEARNVRVVGTEGSSVLVTGEIGPNDEVIVGAGSGLTEGEPVVAVGTRS